MHRTHGNSAMASLGLSACMCVQRRYGCAHRWRIKRCRLRAPCLTLWAQRQRGGPVWAMYTQPSSIHLFPFPCSVHSSASFAFFVMAPLLLPHEQKTVLVKLLQKHTKTKYIIHIMHGITSIQFLDHSTSDLLILPQLQQGGRLG